MTEKQPALPKTKVMCMFPAEPWRLMRIHAAANGYKSAQELLETLMQDWLSLHPLNLEDIVGNSSNEN